MRLHEDLWADALLSIVMFIVFVIVQQPTLKEAVWKGALLIGAAVIVVRIWNKYLGD
jgi:hypothetical protein